MPEALVCEDLRVRFADVRALDGASLRIEAGEVMALLGPSGCGKTTLLRCVAGLQRGDGGVIRVGERALQDGRIFVPPDRRGVGLVFQEYALFPHLTVAGNVGYGLPRGGESSRRVAELLAMGGLSGMEIRYPHQLSGGQQQRVAVLRSLAPRPSVLLLDEPFSNLDAMLRASMRAQVGEMLRAEGVTALIVTHDRADAFSVADRVAAMSAGRVEQVGTAEDLYFRPSSALVAAITGEVQYVEGDLRGASIETVLGPLAVAGDAAPGRARAAIRPEWLMLASEGTGADILGAALEGGTWRVSLALPDGTRLVASVPAGHAAPAGTVHVAVTVAVPVFPLTR